MKLISYTSCNKRVFRKLYGVISAIIILATPYFIMLVDSQVESSQSLCPHKMLTGLPCPGCGITKSLIFLYKGDFYRSVSYHIFGPLIIFGCVWLITLLTVEIATGKEYFNGIFFSKKLAYVLGATLGVYHLSRLIYFIYSHSISEILKESIWM